MNMPFLTRNDWIIIEQALRAAAHSIAGHSQAPTLIKAEDTIQWRLAQRIKSVRTAKPKEQQK